MRKLTRGTKSASEAAAAAPPGPFPAMARSASASSSSSSTSIACRALLMLDEPVVTALRSGTGFPSFSRMWSIAGWSPRPPVALTAPADRWMSDRDRRVRGLDGRTFYARGIESHAKKGVFIAGHVLKVNIRCSKWLSPLEVNVQYEAGTSPKLSRNGRLPSPDVICIRFDLHRVNIPEQASNTVYRLTFLEI